MRSILQKCAILIPVLTVFLRLDAAATISFVRLLFKGGVYFYGKLTDINDSWIGYPMGDLIVWLLAMY